MFFSSYVMLSTAGDSCRQFATVMCEQLDLRVEASHLKTFRKRWVNDAWGQFPQPINEYVHVCYFIFCTLVTKIVFLSTCV